MAARLAIIAAMPATPRWLIEPDLHRLCSDPHAAHWLQERGSLTARLRAHWGDVTVHPIEEGLALPLPHEAQRLALAPNALAWVRCVELRCQGQARIHARTVIPHWSPLNPWTEVQSLGRQPLGELLFSLPDLKRSAFEWAQWPSPQNPGQPQALARRCVFERAEAPLLLTEVFLDLPPCAVGGPAESPKRGRPTVEKMTDHLDARLTDQTTLDLEF